MTDRRDHDADPGDHETDPADHDADLRDHDGPIPMITMHRSGRSRWADVRTPPPRKTIFNSRRLYARDVLAWIDDQLKLETTDRSTGHTGRRPKGSN